MSFEDTLLSCGLAKKKKRYETNIFDSVDIWLLEDDNNQPEDGFDDGWYVYLNDLPFAETMKSAFDVDGEYFNAFAHRKLRKDTSGNLGMVLASIFKNEDGQYSFHTGGSIISVVDFFAIPCTIKNYEMLIDHMLSDSGLGSFFAFIEDIYVYLYLCGKAGWTAKKTATTLKRQVNKAPFFSYMWKKNVHTVDDVFVKRFFSHLH